MGDLPTYRRAMDRRVHLLGADLEALRQFRRPESHAGPTLAAVERARLLQRRVFGDRTLATPSAELIEYARRERTAELS